MVAKSCRLLCKAIRCHFESKLAGTRNLLLKLAF